VRDLKTLGLLRALLEEPLPPPGPGEGAPMHERVLERSALDPVLRDAVQQRAAMGLRKYKTYLHAYDGRGPADMWQEVLDLIQYLERTVAEEDVHEVRAVLAALSNIVEAYRDV